MVPRFISLCALMLFATVTKVHCGIIYDAIVSAVKGENLVNFRCLYSINNTKIATVAIPLERDHAAEVAKTMSRKELRFGNKRFRFNKKNTRDGEETGIMKVLGFLGKVAEYIYHIPEYNEELYEMSEESVDRLFALSGTDVSTVTCTLYMPDGKVYEKKMPYEEYEDEFIQILRTYFKTVWRRLSAKWHDFKKILMEGISGEVDYKQPSGGKDQSGGCDDVLRGIDNSVSTILRLRHKMSNWRYKNKYLRG